MFLIAMFSGLSGYLLHVLGGRVDAAEDEVAKVWSGYAGTDLGRACRDYCQAAVAVDLLPAASRPGLAALPVRYRDHNDKVMTVGDLMKEMTTKCSSHSFSDLTRLVRLFYQLEYSLDASPELGGRVLRLLESRLEANDGTRTIGHIERVKRGQRCDTQTMTPVRSGSHVEQPLGFILYTPEKKVMSKAEVLCR